MIFLWYVFCYLFLRYKANKSQHPFIQTSEPLNTLSPLVISARKARAEERKKKGGM